MFQPPKGTRDFGQEQMIRRNYITDKIKNIFVSYGFDEVQTPVLESFELLAAKGGLGIKDEIYYFKDKADREIGLRPDLTVGLARVLASNPNLPKPFKRYFIAPAWRYEEVTTGRKREFWQADIDIAGVSSMQADAECIACAVDCLKALGFKDFIVKINNRKILSGILTLADIKKDIEVFRAVDKLGKISDQGVKEELRAIGLSDKQINSLLKFIAIKGDCEKILKQGKKLLAGIKIGEEGLSELKELYEFSKVYGFSNFLNIDFSLARGLDYYTGPVFEIITRAKKSIGSVAGGGRYDNLIRTFGGPQIPATGISIGIERIAEIMQEQQMFKLPKTNTKIFVIAISEEEMSKALEIAQKLRNSSIPTETDLMSRKVSKQFEGCNKKGIPYVAIVGPRELEKNSVKLRDMRTGKEKLVKISELAKEIKP